MRERVEADEVEYEDGRESDDRKEGSWEDPIESDSL